jgi:glycosyltransferase involved in cell wall biosynthesis
MKVIHILYRATVGGAERVVYNLVNEQLKNNYQVACILLAEGGGFFEKFRSLLGTNLFVFRINHYSDMIKLYNLLNNEKKDWIIHSHVRNLKLGFILKFISNPKILTEHLLTERLKDIYPKNYRKLKLFYRFYEKDYRYVTSVSQAVKYSLCNEYRIDSKKVKVVFNGIQGCQPQQGNKNGYFYIGNATHFEKIKNIDLFLSIAEKLSQIEKSFRFLLIGDGTQKNEILSFINEKKLHENVFVLEQQEDLTSFFNQLNLGLITSFSETFSLFAAECLVRGIPVVTSADGGLKEVVSDNESGYLIDSFREDDFIEKILKLKNDKKLYDSFSQGARKRSEKFLVENVFADYHKLYHELVH